MTTAFPPTGANLAAITYQPRFRPRGRPTRSDERPWGRLYERVTTVLLPRSSLIVAFARQAVETRSRRLRARAWRRSATFNSLAVQAPARGGGTVGGGLVVVVVVVGSGGRGGCAGGGAGAAPRRL